MKEKTKFLVLIASLPMFFGSAYGMVLSIDFGDTTASGAGLVNSPYHTANPSFTDTTWNKVTTSDLAAGNVRDSAGTILPLIGINAGQTASTSSTVALADNTYVTNALGGSYPLVAAGAIPAYTSGPYLSPGPGRDGIFAVGGSNAVRGVGIQITGLAAGIYEIYVSSRNTSTSAGTYTQTLYAGAGQAGTDFDYTGAAYSSGALSYTGYNNSTTWVENENYVKLTVTLANGEALNIASAGSATGADKRGFLNSIEIVSVPEPSAMALLGCGVAAFASRRRRA